MRLPTCIILAFCGTLQLAIATAQVKLHAHNDYEKQRPFFDAYENNAFTIEADVYAVHDSLMLAHDKKDIRPQRTLENLYLRPIVSLMQQHNGQVSKDKHYTFGLMIDVKEDPEKVLSLLNQFIQCYAFFFDRSKNPLAVQIVISGNRPSPNHYIRYSSFLFFDGRPDEKYDSANLSRVALISDSYLKYASWKGEGELPAAQAEKLKAVIEQAHRQGKLIRFWATPDTPAAWKTLHDMGVDIINTDQIAVCKKFFHTTSR